MEKGRSYRRRRRYAELCSSAARSQDKTVLSSRNIVADIVDCCRTYCYGRQKFRGRPPLISPIVIFDIAHRIPDIVACRQQREEAKLVAIRGLSELASGFCRLVRSLRQDAALEVVPAPAPAPAPAPSLFLCLPLSPSPPLCLFVIRRFPLLHPPAPLYTDYD